MIRTPEETALLIALLLKRSDQKRARISVSTIRRLSKRKHIRGAFIEMLDKHLDSLGVILVEIDRGGFGLIPSSVLDGAPAITAKKYLSADLGKLKGGKLSFDSIREELDEDIGLDEDDDA